jgi:hypothetical protein
MAESLPIYDPRADEDEKEDYQKRMKKFKAKKLAAEAWIALYSDSPALKRVLKKLRASPAYQRVRLGAASGGSVDSRRRNAQKKKHSSPLVILP